MLHHTCQHFPRSIQHRSSLSGRWFLHQATPIKQRVVQQSAKARQAPYQLMYSHTTAASAADQQQTAGSAPDPIVQYVVLRKDLWSEHKWPLGSVVAQACHASSAAMWLHQDDEVTTTYCAPENLDHMHKVVLEVKSEAQLRALSDKLKEAGIKHKLWIEQPENFATCLASKPYHKSHVSQHFKKFNLLKAPVGAP